MSKKHTVPSFRDENLFNKYDFKSNKQQQLYNTLHCIQHQKSHLKISSGFNALRKKKHSNQTPIKITWLILDFHGLLEFRGINDY